jgi:hypothetical protein
MLIYVTGGYGSTISTITLIITVNFHKHTLKNDKPLNPLKQGEDGEGREGRGGMEG